MADKSVSKGPRDAKPTSEAEIEKWAIGGGSEPGSEISINDTALKMTSIRLPKYLLDQIDASRKKRRGTVSRNNWIWQSIEDTLEREEENLKKEA